jgi:hypothetical protein
MVYNLTHRRDRYKRKRLKNLILSVIFVDKRGAKWDNMGTFGGVTMKALTVRQPFASLIQRGLKTMEYRNWTTAHRGPLAIHAGRAVPCEIEWDYLRAHFPKANDWELGAWLSHLPRGRVLCTVDLVDVVELPSDHYGRKWGRFGWVLANVVDVERKAHAIGKLGLWEWAGA